MRWGAGWGEGVWGAERKAGFRACLIQGGHKLTLHLVFGEFRCGSLPAQAGKRLVDQKASLHQRSHEVTHWWVTSGGGI